MFGVKKAAFIINRLFPSGITAFPHRVLSVLTLKKYMPPAKHFSKFPLQLYRIFL
jgi:hypothetical protein